MASLEVQIGADISGLIKGVTGASGALKSLETKINSTDAELKDLATSSVKASDRVEMLTKAFNDGKIKQEDYSRNLKRLERVQSNYSNKTKELRNNLKNLKRSYNELGGSSKKAADGFKKIDKSSINAVPSVTEFSRVIQDAPFGIQGVANNITQLTSQFGNLSKRAGGSGAALKAMLSTLTGPAGILLAVSAVTSLLVSYGDEIGNLIKGNDALASSQKAVNEALTDFYGSQVSQINAYINTLDNVNISEDERKKVINELIELVPSLKKQDFEYGKNLDLVKAKIASYVLAQASRAEADALVQENSEKLAKKARIDAIKNISDETKRVEAIKDLFEDLGISLNRRIVKGGGLIGLNEETAKNSKDLIQELTRLSGTVDKEAKPIQDKITELLQASAGDGKSLSNYDELIKKQSELKTAFLESAATKGKDAKETLELGKQHQKVTMQVNALKDALDSFDTKSGGKKGKKGGGNDGVLTELDKLVKKQKEVSEALKNSAITNGTGAKETQEIQKELNSLNLALDYYNQLAKGIDKFALTDKEQFAEDLANLEAMEMELDELLGKEITPISTFIDQNSLDQQTEALERFKESQKSVQTQADILANATGAAFSELSNQLASSLQTGNSVMDAFIQSIISSLTDLGIAFLQNLIIQKLVAKGKQATDFGIAQSNAVVIGTNAAAALGPAGLAALPATIAGASGIVTGAFAGIQAFAKGGFSGDDNLAFLNKNELVLRPMEQATLFNALKSSSLGNMGRNKSSASSNNLGILATTVLRGDKQIIQFKRGKKKMNKYSG